MRRAPLAPSRRSLVLLLVAALAAVVAAVGLTAGADDRSAAAIPRVTKLLVVVEENHSLDQMKAGMPYTFGLAQRYGYATDYHALRHPSLPNYIAIASGRTHGVRDDRLPAAHRLRGRTVFSQARRHNRTAAVYAESMPVRCGTDNSGRYLARHNPWTYFVDQRTACRRWDRKYAAFADAVSGGRLPRVGLVVPDVCHDAHNCSLATADAFFERLMARVFAGPDWKAGRLAVVLTADEDDRSQGNKVLTVVIHPSQRQRVVTTRLTHYSLTRLYDEVAGLPYLNNAATAPSMARAFGLPVG